jgi:hypothetical protein
VPSKILAHADERDQVIEDPARTGWLEPHEYCERLIEEPQEECEDAI